MKRLVDEDVIVLGDSDKAKLEQVKVLPGNRSHWKEVLRVQEWKLVEDATWHWIPWELPAGVTSIFEYVTFQTSVSRKTNLPVATHVQIRNSVL